MKKIIWFMTILAMMISLCGCSSGEVPPVGTVLPKTCEMIENEFTIELLTQVDKDDSMIDYGADNTYAYSLENGELIIVREYSSVEKAETYSGYFSADGGSFSWPKKDGDPVEKWNSVEICYIAPIHMWQYGNCIIEHAGDGEVCLKLAELFGSQFAGSALPEPEDDTIEPDITDVEHPDYIDALNSFLAENGLFSSVEEIAVNPKQNAYEFTPQACFFVDLTDGFEIVVYEFESEEQAAKHASNFSASGTSYHYELGDGTGSGYEADYAHPIHWWRVGAVVYSYCGLDDTAATLTEYLGEQFAGGEILDISQFEHPEAAKLARLLNSYYMYLGCELEEYSNNEHSPVAAYNFNVYSYQGVGLYMRIYDSPEAAADEAGNYIGGDPSYYSHNGGVMIIDYIAPVHFWLSGDAIIEFASYDPNSYLAQILERYYGEQFAGDPIGEDTIGYVADGELGFDYADINVGYRTEGLPSETTVINNIYVLEEYRAMYENVFDGARGERFSERCAFYDESFFDNHTLIAIPLYEGSISDCHIVESVVKDGDTVTVAITNYDTGDEAMDFCILFLEIYGKISDNTKVVTDERNVFDIQWVE